MEIQWSAHILGRLIKMLVLTEIWGSQAWASGWETVLPSWSRGLQSLEKWKAREACNPYMASSPTAKYHFRLFLSDHRTALPMGPFLQLSPKFFYLLYILWYLLGQKLIKKRKDQCYKEGCIHKSQDNEKRYCIWAPEFVLISGDSGVTQCSRIGDTLHHCPAVWPWHGTSSPRALCPAL